jgi:hypothetical protein
MKTEEPLRAAKVGVIDGNTPVLTEDGRFPAQLNREYEERLLGLCMSGNIEPEQWRQYGPPFFMAGLAVMMASGPEFDRRSLLDLAEALHEGSSQVGVFSLWLEGSPVRPSRFLPMLEAGLRQAPLPRDAIELACRIIADAERRDTL